MLLDLSLVKTLYYFSQGSNCVSKSKIENLVRAETLKSYSHSRIQSDSSDGVAFVEHLFFMNLLKFSLNRLSIFPENVNGAIIYGMDIMVKQRESIDMAVITNNKYKEQDYGRTSA
jgi:hypothetical protein